MISKLLVTHLIHCRHDAVIKPQSFVHALLYGTSLIVNFNVSYYSDLVCTLFEVLYAA